MSIDRSQPGSGAIRALVETSRREATERPSGEVRTTGDRVDVSRAQELSAFLTAAGEAPDVRESRIEQLRQDIQLGRYEPSPRDVARALIDFEGRS